MKKSKILALSLAVGIALMGAGYAYWNDSVTITNQATTGTIDVQINSTEALHPSASVIEANGNITIDRSDPVWTADAGGKSGTITVENLYEGAQVEITIPVVNNGSIPVIFDQLNTEINAIQPVAGETFSAPIISASASTITNIVLSNTDVTFTDSTDSDNELAEGESGSVTYTFTVGPVSQDTTYKFSVAPAFTQFNNVH